MVPDSVGYSISCLLFTSTFPLTFPLELARLWHEMTRYLETNGLKMNQKNAKINPCVQINAAFLIFSIAFSLLLKNSLDLVSIFYFLYTGISSIPLLESILLELLVEIFVPTI